MCQLGTITAPLVIFKNGTRNQIRYKKSLAAKRGFQRNYIHDDRHQFVVPMSVDSNAQWPGPSLFFSHRKTFSFIKGYCIPRYTVTTLTSFHTTIAVTVYAFHSIVLQ